ncbi:hypothetical protein DEO72_LG8g1977 [Vigna unguiculata]|uniref:Uncharacterized protein n=1 Tax=Vigna unguiculata TaxID=3917 RepID=A0A4D6MVL9_VIGUN|nr:hypothetical protein DEO72_LG8g1977 [Vigna unguiculata]
MVAAMVARWLKVAAQCVKRGDCSRLEATWLLEHVQKICVSSLLAVVKVRTGAAMENVCTDDEDLRLLVAGHGGSAADLRGSGADAKNGYGWHGYCEGFNVADAVLLASRVDMEERGGDDARWLAAKRMEGGRDWQVVVAVEGGHGG